MIKYIFTLIALSMVFTATARKPKNTRTTEAAAREIAAADSLRLVASRQAAQIASLHNIAFYLRLVTMARQHIAAGDFKPWKEAMVGKLQRRL